MRLSLNPAASMISALFVALVASYHPVTQAAPCAGFDDVDSANAFCPNVEWMKNRGITNGCSATQYCPDNPVTRLQMAAFLARFDKVAGHYYTDANGTYMGKRTQIGGDMGVELVLGGKLAFISEDVFDERGFRPQTFSAFYETMNCTGQPYTDPLSGSGTHWGRHQVGLMEVGGGLGVFLYSERPTDGEERTIRSSGDLDGSNCYVDPLNMPYLMRVVEFTPTIYQLPQFVPPFNLH